MTGQTTRCVICDRERCGHNAARYIDRTLPLSPVETQVGEELRQEAIRILRGRYEKLVADSTTYSFSSIEGTVMAATEKALDTLQAMAPQGDLRPARAGDWWGTALSTATERA